MSYSRCAVGDSFVLSCKLAALVNESVQPVCVWKGTSAAAASVVCGKGVLQSALRPQMRHMALLSQGLMCEGLCEQPVSMKGQQGMQ